MRYASGQVWPVFLRSAVAAALMLLVTAAMSQGALPPQGAVAPPFDTKVCAQGGFAGVNAKICKGPDGRSASIALGAPLSVGLSRSISNDGTDGWCLKGNGTAGLGPMWSGSVGICRDNRNRGYVEESGGMGVGAGLEGMKLGATVEATHKHYVPASPTPTPLPGSPIPDTRSFYAPMPQPRWQPVPLGNAPTFPGPAGRPN